jgi:hypothetical protein
VHIRAVAADYADRRFVGSIRLIELSEVMRIVEDIL